MAAYISEDLNNPEKFFQVKIYTGNGGTQTITYDNTDADLDADLIWLKSRSDAYSHQLFDTVRGATKLLNPEATDAEQTLSGVTAFATDTFAIGSDAGTNGSSKTYVAWCWKESATAGMDITTFTGNQTARTISHSLSAKPEWLWIKNREKVESYHMQHGSLGATSTQESNTNGAFGGGSTIWNDTEPTTSVYSVGNNGNINETGSDIVVWLWAGKQGYSKFGKYIGNGNDNGTFVYTGFKPAFVMQKNSSATGSWHIHDNKRSINGTDKYLYPDTNEAEVSTTRMDFLSNGFKLRSDSSAWNNSGDTFVYMAFAESPLVNSKGVPNNAK